MVRKLALAVALALGSTSMTAYGLGLGAIKTRSALNQALDAEIELLSVAKGELEGLRVQLAPPEAFDQAGIDRPHHLTQLQFEPVGRSGGRHVIRVTTEFPVREPFLNFLVEANWPNGRVLREYTVLLDPPTTTKRRAPRVDRTVAADSPAAAVERPDQPAADQYGPVQANETLWGIAREVRPGGVSMPQMMMALLDANPQAFIDNNINRLRRGQILRVPSREEILSRSRGEAQAMYREQQDAWLASRAPVVPPAATAEAATADAAGSAPPDDARLRIATPKPDGEGTPGAVKAGSAADAAQADIGQQLLMARENAETSRLEAEQLRSRVDDLRSQLDDMQRLLTLKNDQLAKLQGSVSASEAMGEDAAVEAAATVEEAATVEATEAAAQPALDEVASATAGEAEPGLAETLDQAAATVTGAVEEALALEPPPDLELDTTPEPATAMPAGEVDLTEVIPELEAAAETVAALEGAAPEVEVPDVGVIEERFAPTVEEPVVEEPAAVATATVEEAVEEIVVGAEDGAEADAAQSEELVVAAVETPEPPPATAAEPPAPGGAAPGEASGPGSLPMILGGVGAVAAIGAIFGLVVARRNRRSETAMAAPATDSMGEPRLGQATADALEESDSSLLSELSPTEMDDLQDDTGDVDPVSEADVYIAYGRYQQAEQLLQQAMEKDTQRVALPHKLLEVYYAMQQPDAFVGLAGEMMADGRDQVDPDAWARVKEMGRELAPNNPMFTVVAGAAGVAALGAAQAKAEGVGPEDLELSELASEVSSEQVEPAPQEQGEDSNLDLDSLTRELESQAVDQDSLALDDLETFDLDVSSEAAGTAVAAKLQGQQDEELLDLGQKPAHADDGLGEDSMMKLDPDLDLSEMQSELDDLSDMTTLDAELAALGGDAPSEEPLSLDLPVGDEGADLPLDAADAANVDDASQFAGDEVDTKIDLARAYVEMGDADGARSILAEVQEEGSSEQKEEARQLLEELSA